MTELLEYEYYKYTIEPVEVEIATGRHEEHPQTITGYEFIIKNVYISGDDDVSDEWFETEEEAALAAEARIDYLNSERVPDYDVEPYGQIDWDERRRMGE